MSNETIKLFGQEKFRLLSLSIKLKESGTVLIENFFNTEIKKVDKFDCDDLVIDKMGLYGTSFSCVFGSPYNLVRCEPKT